MGALLRYSESEGFDLRSLFESGQYSLCLHLLGDNPPNHLFALRMRCLIRLGEWNAAIAPGVIRRVESLNVQDKFEASYLLAAALHRSGSDQAEEQFAEAYRQAQSLGVESDELNFLHATYLWSQLDFDRSEVLVQALLRKPGFELKALDLLSWIAAGRGDLDLQKGYLRKAMSTDGDPWHTAHVLHAFAHLVSERFDFENMLYLEERAGTFTFTEDMYLQEFYTYRGLAIARGLSGATYKAFDHFLRAERAAFGHPELLALNFADRSFCAMVVGDTRSSEEYAKDAARFAKEANFRKATAERVALLYLTMLFARIKDPQAAQYFYNEYQSIQTEISPIKAFGLNDKRRFAFEMNAQGWLFASTGYQSQALECFGKAFEVWKSIGYEWRAVLAALYLCEFEIRPELLDYCVDVTDRSFPNAWFTSRLNAHRARKENPLTAELSVTKRGVLLGLERGLKYREIADALSISENNVRNHVQDLFDRFTPSNRSRLALLNALSTKG